MSKQNNKVPPLIASSELARLLGITPTRVGQLSKEGVLHRSSRGLFDTRAAVQSFIAHRERIAGEGAGTGAYGSARTRLLEARAALTEMEKQERAGLLVPADQLQPAWSAAYGASAQRLLASPSRAAARLGMCKTTAERQELLRGLVYEAMESIRTMPVIIAGLAPGEPGEEPDSTPGEPDDDEGPAGGAEAAPDADAARA